MTEFDTDFVPMAVEMLAEFGKQVTFRVYPEAVYDPETGKNTIGEPADYTVKAIPPYSYEAKYIDGDTVLAGDMQTGIAASGLEFTPKPSETKVVIDSVEWSIVSVQPQYSGEQIAVYLIQLRK